MSESEWVEGKHGRHLVIDATLLLSERHDGFWLYDKTRGMNLAMQKATERDAFVSALKYYQERLAEVGGDLTTLRSHVATFVAHVAETTEEPE